MRLKRERARIPVNYIHIFFHFLYCFFHSLTDNRYLGPYSSRYIGSMVGDIHRTLLYGGIFGYPADRLSPEGKLRLVYESAPMSFLVEQAGGKSSTGSQSIMDVMPTSLDQRIPTFLGDKAALIVHH